MKRKLLKSSLMVALMLASNSLFANAFTDAMETFSSEWIYPAFPIVAAAAFIVGILKNIGLLSGEDRDLKKAFINIILYPAAIAVIVGAFEGVKALASQIS